MLGATKIIPKELIPLRVISRMVLGGNPDNFHAETKQMAFYTTNIVAALIAATTHCCKGTASPTRTLR